MKDLDPQQIQQVHELWTKHGGERHGPRVETVTMPLSRFLSFVEDVRRLALYATDGGFMCTPDHAVEVAQMVSNAESTFIDRDVSWGQGDDTMDLLKEYLTGEKSTQEVNKELLEIHKQMVEDTERRAAKQAPSDG